SDFYLADSHISFDYLLAGDARAQLLLQGRYAVNLTVRSHQELLTYEDAGGLDVLVTPENVHGVPPLSNAIKPAGEWQRVEVKFRSPRFDDAHNKTENALFVEVKLNGVLLQQNVIAAGVGKTSRFGWEDHAGPFILSSN